MQIVKKDSQTLIEQLSDKANFLPELPGCYLMLNKHSEIIYIGKAKNLKNRVASYFTKSTKSHKTEVMISHVVDFEFRITDSEAHALILENNLIKTHRPKYNILLKDDKTYPYLVIDNTHDFPKILYTRKVSNKKKHDVLGPFVHVFELQQLIKSIQKIFQLRVCSDSEFKKRKRPCLLFQMQQCCAPCVEHISKDEYKKKIQMVINFFKGKSEPLIESVSQLMDQAAEREQFEYAIKLRDFLAIAQKFNSQEWQTLNKNQLENIDVISSYVSQDSVDISIYSIRNGVELGQQNFTYHLSEAVESVSEESLKIIINHYLDMPDNNKISVYVSDEFGDLKLIQTALNLSRPSLDISIKPINSSVKTFYDLALASAKENQRVRKQHNHWNIKALESLQKLLKLKQRPIIIECYDIAIWQGKSPTGSQVVFHNGIPDRSSYRHYLLEELPEGNNDFYMMKVLLQRRLKHDRKPDVIIVDGGKGQLNIVKGVLDEFQESIPVIGIAKQRTKEQKEERLFFVNRKNPFQLKKDKDLMKLIVLIRNEAHRFARRLHHKKERERIFS